MRFLSALPFIFAATAAAAQRAQTPRSGREVLEAMRAAYDGKWYHSLTFTQKTTFRNQDGTERVATWREALRHTGATGAWLRIDVGDLKDGNGILYTADSSWRIRGGKASPGTADGNVFLPMIEGVYVQPVDRTIRQLASAKIDMSKVYQTKWQGRDTWVVGASSAADTTSAQFWIDVERKVAVRMLLNLAPNRPPYDVQLGGYERVGNGWLATKVVMSQGGVPQQTEEYSDWKIDVPLDAALFDPAQWTTVKHWTIKP